MLILCSLGSNCIKYVQKSSLIEKVGNLYVCRIKKKDYPLRLNASTCQVKGAR